MELCSEWSEQTPQGGDKAPHDRRDPGRLPAAEGDRNRRYEQRHAGGNRSQPSCKKAKRRYRQTDRYTRMATDAARRKKNSQSKINSRP